MKDSGRMSSMALLHSPAVLDQMRGYLLLEEIVNVYIFSFNFHDFRLSLYWAPLVYQ